MGLISGISRWFIYESVFYQDMEILLAAGIMSFFFSGLYTFQVLKGEIGFW